MADPLLSSLCNICHTNPPKYTCPRCRARTCSMPCLKRHKVWNSCSGVRDPTVFKPAKELKTPEGVDHDYNFLHKIERDRWWAKRELVDERKLVDKYELDGEPARKRVRDESSSPWKGSQRGGRGVRSKKGPRRQRRGEEPVLVSLRKTNTRVEHAPKGMQRNKENTTNWSRSVKCINWTVEWMIMNEDGSKRRILGKILDNTPLGKGFGSALEWDRREKMSDEERRKEKRRIENEKLWLRERKARKKSNKQWPRHLLFELSSLTPIQKPDSSWDFSGTSGSNQSDDAEESNPEPPSHILFVHRTHTPSSVPTILIPTKPEDTLGMILKGRTIMEFPTIYAIPLSAAKTLMKNFLLEKDYLRMNKKDLPLKNERQESSDEEGEIHSGDSDDEEGSGSDDDSEDDTISSDLELSKDEEEDDETSSSGTSSDEEMDTTG